jgi:hypothetical protein
MRIPMPLGNDQRSITEGRRWPFQGGNCNWELRQLIESGDGITGDWGFRIGNWLAHRVNSPLRSFGHQVVPGQSGTPSRRLRMCHRFGTEDTGRRSPVGARPSASRGGPGWGKPVVIPSRLLVSCRDPLVRDGQW